MPRHRCRVRIIPLHTCEPVARAGTYRVDFIDKYPEAYKQLGTWYKEGKLTFREDVREGGLDAFPDVLKLLYTGGNFGKLILKV